MAHILCINPWIYDFAAYNLWIEPLGLLSIAAAVRQAGHTVALIDCLDRHHPRSPAPQSPRDCYGCGQFHKVELRKPPVLAHIPRRWGRYGLPVEVFEAELDAQMRPDAVLVTSTMTYWYPGPFEAIRRVKARWPQVPIALGGVYATLCPDHARTHSGADVVFTGPGEAQVLDWIEQIIPRSSSICLPNHPTTQPPNYSAFPAHDLRRPQGYTAVLTARGCPFACPYCAVHQLGPTLFSPRSPDCVIDEIVWCVESLEAQDIVFYDDALLFDTEHHITPILDGIIERGLRARFHTPNGLHAQFIDRPLAHKMRRAGFKTIFLGLETADPIQQQRDGAKVDDAHFRRAAQALYDAGFMPHEVAAYVLIARPGQSIASAQATVEFAHQLRVRVVLAEYTPIPGTVEWQKAVEMGLIAVDADPLLHNKAIYPCAHPDKADMVAWEKFKQKTRMENRRLCQ
ncbi:MAG: cobalamin-dependent protein [Anaerolineae bacterium]|nr:cobalamin-dependent protein [Anaerolineae bacterium]